MREILVRHLGLAKLLLLACALLGAVEQATAAPPEEPAEPLPAGAVLRIGTVRFQHAQAIRLEFSPDGKRILTVAWDGIRLWDTATGKPVREIQLDHLNFAGFTADGKTIVAWNANPEGNKGLVGSGDNPVVHVFDAETGKELRQFALKEAPDGVSVPPSPWINPCPGLTRLATAVASRGPLILRDVMTGKEIRRFESEKIRNLGNSPEHMRFSPDGKQFAGSNADAYWVFDTETGKEVHRLPVDAKRNKGRWTGGDDSPLLFAPDGKVLASGRRDDSIYFWDLTTGKQICRIKEFLEDTRVEATFSPDGKTYCTWESDQGVRFWELPSGKLVHQLKLQCARGMFAPNNKLFALQAWDALHFIDVNTHKVIHKVADGFTSISFSPDGRVLAALQRDTGRVQLWRIPSFERDEHFTGDSRAVEFLALAKDGKSLASWNGLGQWQWNELPTGKKSSSFSLPQGQFSLAPDGLLMVSQERSYEVDEALVLHDASTGKEKCRIAPRPTNLSRVFTLSADASLLAVGSWRYNASQFEIGLYETGEGKLVRKFEPFPLEAGEGPYTNYWHFYRLVFSPDARTLAVSGSRSAVVRESHNGVYLWDVGRGKKHSRVWGKQEADHFVYTPDGRCLLLVNRGEPTRLLEVASGVERARFEETTEAVPPFVFSDDGKFLASARKSQTLGNSPILIWDAYTGKKLQTLPGHADRVLSLAFTPDSKRLISGSADSTILVWDLGDSAKAQVNPITRERLERSWQDLGSDAARAHAAIGVLVQAPDQVLPLLKERLRPEKVPALDKLVGDLDANQFATREKATRQLEGLGPVAEPALRKVLAGKPSEEMRRRIESILARMDGPPPADVLREHRAIEVLERIATPQSIELLEALARVAPGALLSDEAKEALARLKRRLP